MAVCRRLSVPDAKLCWRPGSSDNKEEGIWMKKGESRIWRRKGEREVATNKKQTGNSQRRG